MRKVIVSSVIAVLVAGLAVAPAGATKKKKAPPRVIFEASGEFVAGHPIDGYSDLFPASRSGVTANEFVLTCAIPESQGFDGYVVALPEGISVAGARVRLETEELATLEGVYVGFYDANCEQTGYRSPDAAETKYILVTGWVGAKVTFDLFVEER